MNKILIGIFTAATVGFCHADEFKDFKKAIVEESRDKRGNRTLRLQWQWRNAFKAA